jgi:ribose-phosphate pyrophosphokinase
MSTKIKVNDQFINSFQFNGGEVHVDINHIEITDLVKVEAYLYNSDDIMKLMMTIDAIREKKVFVVIELTIPYFPYGRQDRVCNPGEAFSASVMANMINSLECQKVTILDPHSYVTPSMLMDYRVITQNDILQKYNVIDEIKALGLTLVSPDAGAESKTREIARENNIYAIYCSKIRNTKTGHLTSTTIPDIIPGENFIIIDDICDGGWTFTNLAEKLKAAGAKDIYLYVTHGIFSKGLEPLKKHFKHVYCFHTFLKSGDIDTNFLSILKD